MAVLNCPNCGKSFDAQDPEAPAPFCSERCRSVDLGRWLSEEYGLPIEGDEMSSNESQATQ
jgi:endogenous inhibitor of DNA gyrase (YacG/DUF329 family)